MSDDKPESNWEPEFGLGRLHDAQCFVYAPISRWRGPWESLEPLIANNELGKALTCASQRASRREVFENVSSAAKSFFAIHRHEQDHLRRLNGTSLGLLIHHGYNDLARAGLQLLRTASNEDDFDRSFPMRLGALKGRQETTAERLRLDFEHHSALERTHLIGMSFASLIQSLDRNSREPIRQAASEFALLEIPSVGRLNPSDESDLSVWSNQNDVNLPGARQLLEFAACTEEISALGMIGADSVSEVLQMIQNNPDYRIIFNWLAGVTNDFYFTNVGKLRATDLMGDAYRIATVEFWAAVDLSLWPPYTPAGLDFSSDRCVACWSDIHPGTRFLSIVDAMRQVGIDKQQTPITADEREQVFDDMQNSLCYAFGWPTPRQIAKQWLDELNLESWNKLPIFLGRIDIATRELMIQVLNARLQAPFDSVMNNINWNSIANSRFQCWVVEGNKGLETRVVGEFGNEARSSFLIKHTLMDLLFDSYRTRGYCEADRLAAFQMLQNIRAFTQDWTIPLLNDRLGLQM